MPKDFMFFVPRKGFTTPLPQDLWVPFRVDPLGYARGEGPPVTVFGRLAPGATREALRAELTTLAARAATMESLDIQQQVKPEVLTFDRPIISGDGLAASGVLTLSAVFLVVLMVVVCGNVALLLFARAATREGEIAVRTALGASRGRIVAQLFAEALVIAALAIAVGLAGATVGLRWMLGVMQSMFEVQGRMVPSWIDGTLSPGTVAYAVVLAVVGAVVAGVLPGLKVTGKRAQSNLQRLAGRGAATSMGGVWTAVIITQVALTSLLVPIAVVFGLQTRQLQTADHGLPAPEYLTAQLETDGDATAVQAGAPAPATGAGAIRDDFQPPFEQGVRALERRLMAEPGVLGVTVGSQMPGGWHSGKAIEVEGMSSAVVEPGSSFTQVASVDPDFLDVMSVRLVAGRRFGEADAGPDQRVAIVNESFVHEHLHGRNAVGQRVRYKTPPESPQPAEWYTIVGVVRDVAMTIDPTLPHNAGIYYPLQPGQAYPLRMAVRVASDPAAFAGRLHEIGAEAAPALRLSRVLPLHQAARANLIAHDSWFKVIVVAGLMALLLTNAGIYAIISFTVARRTREIGVRVALGADRGRVVTAILSRTARHVGIGVVIGGTLGGVGALVAMDDALGLSVLQGGGMLLAYMVLMIGVCLLACVVPTRRALRIQPTEALAAEG
jgi:predicted permease